jgi:hypothetical protein
LVEKYAEVPIKNMPSIRVGIILTALIENLFFNSVPKYQQETAIFSARMGNRASIKTEDGVWKISDFVFNSNLTKNTDIEKTELEDNIKSIKSDN